MPEVTEPSLADVGLESFTPDDVEMSEVERAFDATGPLVRQRACKVCQ